jgi:cyclopropane fatty-acyl-phospholipid synthase-like methyltransferase
MSKEQVDDWYDEEYFDHYPKHDRRIAQIQRRLSFNPSDQVCEFGSGLGHILFAISDQIQSGLGIDVSEYAVQKSAEAAAAAGIDNIEFASIDIERLDDNSRYANSFDKVLMMDISEHLYDDTISKFFESAKAVLKPGGELLIHTPNADYYLERMKARNFIVKQFESHIAVRNFGQHLPLLEAAGFSNVRVEYLPHYNKAQKMIDSILMHIPGIRSLFRARLLLSATAS